MIGHQQSGAAGPFRAIVRLWHKASVCAVQGHVRSWG
jgi:hypothetical protein